MSELELLEQIEKLVSIRSPTISIVIPRGWKRPKGFPRGEKLNANGVYAIPIGKLYDYLVAQARA